MALMRLKAVAQETGLSRSSLYNLRDLGILVPKLIAVTGTKRRAVRYDSHDVDRYMASNGIMPPGAAADSARKEKLMPPQRRRSRRPKPGRNRLIVT